MATSGFPSHGKCGFTWTSPHVSNIVVGASRLSTRTAYGGEPEPVPGRNGIGQWSQQTSTYYGLYFSRSCRPHHAGRPYLIGGARRQDWACQPFRCCTALMRVNRAISNELYNLLYSGVEFKLQFDLCSSHDDEWLNYRKTVQ